MKGEETSMQLPFQEKKLSFAPPTPKQRNYTRAISTCAVVRLQQTTVLNNEQPPQ